MPETIVNTPPSHNASAHSGQREMSGTERELVVAERC